MSESHSFNLDQFYVYQSIIQQLIDQTFSYFHDPWRYTNYIYDNIQSWKKELIDYQVQRSVMVVYCPVHQYFYTQSRLYY